MEVRRMNEKNSKNKKGMSMKGQRTLAYIVLIIISFFCLFWFYVLFINATRSNGALKKGFTAIPGGHLIEHKPVLSRSDMDVLFLSPDSMPDSLYHNTLP